MIRLLIVDDEEMIVDGLVQLFEGYENLELDIFRAYSAVEAIDWLKRTSIDIVLTDIRMPGMSGLELQQEIRRLWPWSKVIFLTGFEDFDYIQNALRNEAEDYILKTESDETIVAAIEKAVNGLRRQFESEQLLNQAKNRMKSATPLLQHELLWGILQGQTSVQSNLEQQLKELELPLTTDLPFILLLGRIDDWPSEMKTSDRMLLIYSLQNIMSEVLETEFVNVMLCYDQFKLVWMIQQNGDTSGPWERKLLFLAGALEKVQSVVRQLLKLAVSFLSSDDPLQWNTCAEKFQQLKSMFAFDLGMKRELLLREKNVIAHFQEAAYDREAAVRVSMNKMLLLETYLETGQRDEFFMLIAEFARIAGTTSRNSDGLKLQLYYSIAAIFLSHMNRTGRMDAYGLEIDLGLLTRLESHPDWEAAIQYLTQLADKLFAYKHRDAEERDGEVVRVIKRYVENNLASDLSLTRIGEITGFNPSYLSRLYKQISGQSLSEYITEVRLNKAKELLRMNTKKIHEIAEALGFESATYFARFFRKAANVSPTEYREKLGVSDD